MGPALGPHAWDPLWGLRMGPKRGSKTGAHFGIPNWSELGSICVPGLNFGPWSKSLGWFGNQPLMALDGSPWV